MKENIESLGRFELKNGVSKIVVGAGSTYTFQLIGNGSATLYGSMNDEDWTWMATMNSTLTTPDSFTGSHTWRYLKAELSNGTVLYGNRG